MEQLPADEGKKVITKNLDDASHQDREDSDIGAEHANTQVSAATVGLSGALSGSTGERETAACSSDTVETVQEAQVSQAAAPQGQSVQLQPQHHVQQHVVCQPLSQGSVEHQADTEQQALHHFAISLAPQPDTQTHQAGPTQSGLPSSSAALWLPDLTAVIQQQRQQLPHTSQQPPLQQPHSLPHQLSAACQQQQPITDDAYTHAIHEQQSHASLSCGSPTITLPSSLQKQPQQLSHQLQPAPSSSQAPLVEAPTASSGVSDQQQQNGPCVGLISNQLGLHGHRGGSPGGSSSSQPQHRDAAAQTHAQPRPHQLPTERQAFSGATSSGGDISGDDSSDKIAESRGAKKPRLVWTSELHARFMNAVNHLGVKNAVPKTILQLMNVDGMTRENVASHLQKYRLYLKKLGGYAANAKTSPEALQQVQQQALQQQAHEAFQANLSAMQGLPSHNTNQGYFGPASLYYSPAVAVTGNVPHDGLYHPGHSFQPQPQGLSAAPAGWLPAAASGHQAFDNQREPALQQMATAYGLLPRGQQATGQGSAASGPFVQQPQPWSWGQAPTQAGPWGNPGQHSHPGHPQMHGMIGHSADEGTGSVPGGSRHDPALAGQMPDALAHLLSAAEAASSVKK
ncbi:hypothetical protein ABBQ38_015246 [Trebouxia sp. C0009 RCD-2024]